VARSAFGSQGVMILVASGGFLFACYRQRFA
jgi:hypothetical protein